MNSLVKRACEGPVCHDDVEPLESGDAREEIPVDRMEPVLIAGAVADGNDDVPPRAGGGCREDRFAHRVFVDAAGLHASPLEVAERRGEKPGLSNQPVCPAIRARSRLEPSQRQPLEVVDRLLMALQGVEELEHCCNESGPDAERRIGARLHGRAARNGEQRLPLRGGIGRPFMGRLHTIEQAFVELTARDEVGEDGRARGNGAQGNCHPVFDRPNQVRGRRARRDDHQAIARAERRPVRRERNQRAAEGLEIRRPNESGRAGSDHRRRGGSSSARMSCCTRATIRSAPAADDEACHAIVTLPDDTAS